MGIRAGLLRRLVKATGISIIDTVELRRLHAQCGTLRSEKARIQTQANQYHDQLDKLRAAHERAIKGKDLLYKQLGFWVNRALEAEQIAEKALTVGLAECEALRHSVYEAQVNEERAIEGEAEIQRSLDAHDSKLTAMRVALTNAGVPELEALPFDAHTPEYKRNSRSLGGVERIERLAAERDAAIARAEKAEAKSNEASADATSYATDLYAARHRITELNTFLDQVAEIVDAVHHQSMGPLISGTPDEVVAAARDAVAERNALRTKLAALTAPVEGEPTAEVIRLQWTKVGSGVEFGLNQWRAGFRAGRDNSVKELYGFAPDGLLQTCDREQLGQIVREVWIAWAKEQPAPKPSWLVPWESLSEPDKEVDRRIGERLFRVGAGACIAWSFSDEPAVEGEAGTSAEVNGVSDGAYAFLWRSGFTAGVNKVKQVAAMFMGRPLVNLKQPTDTKLEEVHKINALTLHYRTACRALFNFGVEQGLSQLREAIEEVEDGHVAPKATVEGESK